MKRKYKIACLLGALTLGSLGISCKKLLEVPANKPGQLITSGVFADSTGAVNGVVGIYIKAFNQYGPLSGYMTIYPSLTSDDMTASDPSYAPLYADQQISGNSSNPDGSSGVIWEGFYSSTLIYQANAAIEGLNASTGISNSLRNQLVAECEFVRALCYFDLTNLYGAVPIALTTDYTANNKLPRSSSSVVYTQIIKDLNDATAKLSVNYPSSGEARPNKYAALALLSRVYLYNKQWVKADSCATAIINSGTYQLDALNNVFLVGNTEAIWQGLTASYVTYATQEGQAILPPSAFSAPTFYLTPQLLNTFESGDLRKTAWINNMTVNGTTYYYPFKYQNRPFRQVNGRVEGEVLFRLAELYLIRAEAKINEGDLAGAISDINVIRTRAGLAGTNAQTAVDLNAAVLKERQTEFFCEQGHRWFDLKRLGLLNSVIGAEKTTWPSDGHSALYPVPFIQMKLNPGWAQNPGY